MRFFLTLLFICMLLHGTAQKQGREAADSMLAQLHQVKHDTDKVKLLNELTYVVAGFDQERSVEYARSALQFAEKAKWPGGIITSQKYLGIILMESGKRKEALPHFEKAYQLSENLKDKREQTTILYNIGSLHQHENRYKEALDLYFQGIKLAEETKTKGLLAKGFYLVAVILTQQYNFDKARQYARAAASIYSSERNFHEEANNLEIIGVSYLLEKNFQEAKSPLFNALDLFKKIGNEVGMARIYSQLVECYGDSPAVQLDYIDKSQQIWNANKTMTIYAISNIGNRGIVYFHLYQHDSLRKKMPTNFNRSQNELLTIAEKDLKEGIRLAKSVGNSELLMQFDKSYAALLKEKGDYQQAFEILADSYRLQDTLFSQSTKNKIAAIESTREIEARDKQIQINQLALSNERHTRWGITAGAGLLLVIGGLLFYQNRLRRKTNTTLLTLNNELDEANKVKTKFFGILSHDLRSPIVNLINFLHLQKEMPDLFSKERQVHHQKELTESAESLLETMEAMLLWSKSQMEHFAPQKTIISVHDLFKFLEKQFSASGIAVQFQDPGQLTVSSDEDYLKTIMYNLTSNAVKALGNTEKPQIIWKAWQNENQVKLSITDNGPGVHPEQLDALYNENAVVGTRHGLGLHLIRDLAKAINCRVLHQPGLEKGSVFQIIM
ncbi:tetratricopeptide repeat-containing sensor histidine kinase [Niabella yanshanensis]|uniref:histidine kinase n=1 Tax=Niabella yanshanensis TaxID=577386 RepID=A0ABZ0WD83_9BACT|nr:tetratricopeptide repeat-containing sensor histidine kinase [Niabella yanshanensis]WQD40661.1 tetratricopeptide repeat-containing sensor histidine kinase [Niabella yanshanensis]